MKVREREREKEKKKKKKRKGLLLTSHTKNYMIDIVTSYLARGFTKIILLGGVQKKRLLGGVY